jgi:hypothetical protein
MAIDRVVELRQYTLHPGRRDDLVDVFDRWFVEGQEDLGIRVLGQFYDLDRPDHFVWLRSFPSLEARKELLEAFYGGPVWAAHRDVANDTMMSWDDVLLLRPIMLPTNDFESVESIRARLDADGPDGAGVGGSSRRPIGSPDRPNSLISIDVHHLAPRVEQEGWTDQEAVDFFVAEVDPALTEAGSIPVTLLVTEPEPNNFPALPVREGERVIVRIARFDDESAHEAFRARLARSDRWRDIEARLGARLAGPRQQLRLQPTARSRLW